MACYGLSRALVRLKGMVNSVDVMFSDNTGSRRRGQNPGRELGSYLDLSEGTGGDLVILQR